MMANDPADRRALRRFRELERRCGHRLPLEPQHAAKVLVRAMRVVEARRRELTEAERATYARLVGKANSTGTLHGDERRTLVALLTIAWAL
jgi:hypothetical protein